MADEAAEVVRIQDHFYRDGFNKTLIAFGVLSAAIVLLLSTSIYLVVTKPAPVVFATGKDWRMLPPVSLDQPFLKTPDLLQWVSEMVGDIFTFDFIRYANQLNSYKHFFTDAGWKKFQELLNVRINSEMVQSRKWFVSASAAGAPFVLKQGVLLGKYSWWVQIPLKINYSGSTGSNSVALTVQFLVVRAGTLDDINGVIIDDIVWSGAGQGKANVNG